MALTAKGLIVREFHIGEADRFVTVLTDAFGIIRASVRGARNLKSRNSSATQLLCHSRLTLYKGREKYIVDDAEPLHVFFKVREQLDTLADKTNRSRNELINMLLTSAIQIFTVDD